MNIKHVKQHIQLLKRAIVDGLMMRGYRNRFSNVIVLETTNVCSLNCSCCPNGVARERLRPRGMMSRETFDTLLEQLDFHIKKCYLHMCGEPLLNKDITYFATKLLERKITPVFFSNGYNADLRLLDELMKIKGVQISFSMDIISEKHYERIRKPGKYSVVTESLNNINSVFAKNNRYYGLNMIISSDCLENIGNTCEKLFDKYSNLNTISLSSQWPWPGLPETGYLPGHLRKHPDLCIRYRDLPVVLWNGDVSFCSFDYTGSLIIGNIHHETYTHICNNKKARKIRRNLLMRAYKHQEFCDECLLARYQPLDMVLLRNKFKKMNNEQRAAFEAYLKGYYEA